MPSIRDDFSARYAASYGDTVAPRPPEDSDSLIDEDSLQQLVARHERYTVLGEIARGGMGIILQTWDRILGREVAMKVLAARLDKQSKESGATARAASRFIEEAQVTGQLEHPGVVPVYDLGIDENGEVYFTMPRIRGRDFAAILELATEDDADWPLPRLLAVLKDVCDVVAYAHHRNVLHRDLKPSNIMVGEFGQVYVLDWGLAKALTALVQQRSGEDSTDADATMQGSAVGTPAYMSPEQAHGNVDAIREHADIYALGAILYHILTGGMPYVGRGSRASASAILRMAKQGPPPPITDINPGAPPELVAISDRAMQRRAADRYPSVEAMGSDIRNYLEGRVVAAYEDGAFAQWKKLILRNKAIAVAISAIAIAMIIVTIVHVRVNRDLEALNEQLIVARDGALLDRDKAYAEREATVRKAGDAAARAARATRDAYVARLALAQHALAASNAAEARQQLDRIDPATRGFEAAHLRLRSDESTWTYADGLVGNLVLDATPDLGIAAIGCASGRIVLLDTASRKPVGSWQADDSALSAVLLLPPMGAVVTASENGSPKLWSMDGKRLGDSLAMPPSLAKDSVQRLAATTEGCHVAAGFRSGHVVVWNTRTPSEPILLPGVGRAVVDLRFIDAERLAIAAGTHVFIVSLRSRSIERSLEDHGNDILALHVDARSGVIASGSAAGSVRLWSPRDYALVDAQNVTTSSITGITKLGETYVASAKDGVLHTWDPRVAHKRSLLGHRHAIRAVGACAGERLVSVSSRVRLWEPSLHSAVTEIDHDEETLFAAWSTSGRQIACVSARGTVTVWDTWTRELLRLVRRKGTIAAIPLGAGEMIRFSDVGVQLELADGEVRTLETVPCAFAAYDPKSAVMAGASPEGDLVIVHANAARKPTRVATGVRIRSISIGRGTSFVSVVDETGRISTFGADGSRLRSSDRQVEGAVAAVLDSSRTAFVIASEDGSLHRRSVASGEVRHSTSDTLDSVRSLQVVDDGRRILAISRDGVLRLMESSAFDTVFTYLANGKTCASFDATGTRLLIADRDGVRILESDRSEERIASRLEAMRLRTAALHAMDDVDRPFLDPRDVESWIDVHTDEKIASAARRLVREREYRAVRAAEDAWRQLLTPGLQPADYAAARAALETAAAQTPWLLELRIALAIAYYRAGAADDALDVLGDVATRPGELRELAPEFIAGAIAFRSLAQLAIDPTKIDPAWMNALDVFRHLKDPTIERMLTEVDAAMESKR